VDGLLTVNGIMFSTMWPTLVNYAHRFWHRKICVMPMSKSASIRRDLNWELFDDTSPPLVHRHFMAYHICMKGGY